MIDLYTTKFIFINNNKNIIYFYNNLLYTFFKIIIRFII